MSIEAFISYSHRDEKMLDAFHRHLAQLRRDGLIRVWHDRDIDAGGEIDPKIKEGFDQSTVFLALVSPNFLASDYCYEREMKAAVARHEEGTMTVVPIVIEHCDWKSSPLSKFKALPKDSLPVSAWANQDEAWLNVVTELRRLAGSKRDIATASLRRGMEIASIPTKRERPRFRVKREFDSIERAEFREAAFDAIKRRFEEAAREVNKEETVRARFDVISPTAFTCTVVNRAVRRGESHITVHQQRTRSGLGDITYSHDAHGASNHANGMIQIESDDYELSLALNSLMSEGRHGLSAEAIAENLWKDLLARAGIEYA